MSCLRSSELWTGQGPGSWCPLLDWVSDWASVTSCRCTWRGRKRGYCSYPLATWMNRRDASSARPVPVLRGGAATRESERADSAAQSGELDVQLRELLPGVPGRVSNQRETRYTDAGCVFGRFSRHADQLHQCSRRETFGPCPWCALAGRDFAGSVSQTAHDGRATASSGANRRRCRCAQGRSAMSPEVWTSGEASAGGAGCPRRTGTRKPAVHLGLRPCHRLGGRRSFGRKTQPRVRPLTFRKSHAVRARRIHQAPEIADRLGDARERVSMSFSYSKLQTPRYFTWRSARVKARRSIAPRGNSTLRPFLSGAVTFFR